MWTKFIGRGRIELIVRKEALASVGLLEEGRQFSYQSFHPASAGFVDFFGQFSEKNTFSPVFCL
jgi:hypothetical protein